MNFHINYISTFNIYHRNGSFLRIFSSQTWSRPHLRLNSHEVRTFWRQLDPKWLKKINGQHPRKPDSNLSSLYWTRLQKLGLSHASYCSHMGYGPLMPVDHEKSKKSMINPLDQDLELIIPRLFMDSFFWGHPVVLQVKMPQVISGMQPMSSEIINIALQYRNVGGANNRMKWRSLSLCEQVEV